MAEDETNVVKIEIRDRSWVAIAANGEVVARGEQHTTRRDTERAARGVFPNLGIPIVWIAPEDNDEEDEAEE